MDFGKLLSRSFEITRKYRVLWLFGVLFALFGGSSGGGNLGNFGNFGNFGGGGGSGRGGGTGGTFPTIPAQVWQIIAIIIVAIVCIAILWTILSIVLRLISRGALIGLVQELEAAGTTPTVRRGFGIGASRFWQLLGIALTINLPLFIVSIAILLVAALPVLSAILPMISAGQSPQQIGGVLVGGILGSVLLLCCAGIFLWVVALVIRPFYEFFVRECVINTRGVFDSIREGYRQVRANLGNVAILYILIIGIGIAYGVAMVFVSLLLISIPAGIAIAIGVATKEVLPAVIVGVVIGIPVLLIFLFVSGLYQTFESTLWTEGYLAITAPKTPAVAEPAAAT
jgi:hypothetical protein